MSLLTVNIENQHSDFTLSIEQSLELTGIIGVLGHSGSGKTTLLKSIAGLVPSIKGKISIDDQVLLDSEHKMSLASEKRHIGLVFQDGRLFPHLNVLENLIFAKKRCEHSQLKLEEIIGLTDIEALLTKSVTEISGGEKQRVALARALLAEPRLLLLDEPLSALDQASKASLVKLLKKVHQHLKLPMLYVSHNLDEIQQLADDLLVLNAGKVSHYGQVHQVIHQLNHTGSISQQTSLSLPVTERHNQHGLTALRLDHQQWIYVPNNRVLNGDTSIRCYIFANEISLSISEPNDSSIVNHLKASIQNIEVNDNQCLVTLACGDHSFYASISTFSLEKLALEKQQAVYMQFKASAVRTL